MLIDAERISLHTTQICVTAANLKCLPCPQNVWLYLETLFGVLAC